MTFNDVDATAPTGAEHAETRPGRLRLITQSEAMIDADASTPARDQLTLLVADHTRAATAAPLVDRRYADSIGAPLRRTMPAVNHDAEPAELPPVVSLLRREQMYRRCLAIADALGALMALTIAAAIWRTDAEWAYALAPLFAVIVGKVQGLYDHDDMVIRKSTVTEWRRVLRAAVLTGMATYLVWDTATTQAQERGVRVFALLVLTTFLLTLLFRAIGRRLARRFTSTERCLVVGAPEQCVELASRLQELDGVDLVGIVSTSDVDCSVVGVTELVERLDVHRIVIGPHPAWRERATLELIRSAKWIGVRVSLMPAMMTVVGATTAVDELDSMVLLGVPRFGLSRSSGLLKRAFDVVGASVVLVLVSALMAAVALAIRLESSRTCALSAAARRPQWSCVHDLQVPLDD